MSLLNILGSLLKPATDMIDEVFTNDEERLEAQAKLANITKDVEIKLLEYVNTLAAKRAEVIMAEARGGWLQRNWRPILMMVIIVIIGNNYIIFPYLEAFTPYVKVLELPNGLWALLTAGVSGYIIGRSGEKIASQKWNGKREEGK